MDESGYNIKPVLELAIQPDGTIWARSDNLKLYRISNSTVQRITTNNGLTDYGYSLAVAPDGAVWIGGKEALYRVHGETWTRYSNKDVLFRSSVYPLSVAPDGSVWFGSENAGVTHLIPDLPVSAPSETKSAPDEIVISGNHPNPFNPSTTITFTLPHAMFAEVTVYSITGQKVHSLVMERFPAGTHSLRWDGRDESGNAVASGVYLAVVRAEKAQAVHRMLLVR